MGNTPSHQHGSPARGEGASSLGRAGSTSRRHATNLRLPMPQRQPPQAPAHVSPGSSNPTSPSGRPGSPRRRKSLELPDLNKLSFTPAAPVPTTATNTSNHLATSIPAGTGTGQPGTQPVEASPGRKWQQTLGGAPKNPLSGGLTPSTKIDNSAGRDAAGAPGPVMPGVQVIPVNDGSTHFPSQPIPIRSPRAAAGDLLQERPHPRGHVDVRPAGTPPVRTGLTPPPPTVAATPIPDTTSVSDGLVDVPLQWTGGGRNVYVTGNFADNWRGRIKLKKSTHDFNTVLRLPPGQYRLKFIVDDSWRCSKVIPTATDDDGTLVNWIEVETPKTEAQLQAEWAMDGKPAPKAEDSDDSQWTSEIPAPLVLYQYIEELPQMFPSDVLKQYVSQTPYFSPVPRPPQLPRILERVILNSDTRRPDMGQRTDPDGPVPPAGIDDNAILATPNNSVLNHLMASAIKNGTLGVGTTTRYRKKYITTMFFKSASSDAAPSQQAAPADGQAPSSVPIPVPASAAASQHSEQAAASPSASVADGTPKGP